MTEQQAPPDAYALVLPPGWVQIPLRRGTKRAVKRVIDRTFEHLPRDEVFTQRKEFEESLWQQIRAAREAAGLDLYLPTEPMHGFTVSASILVAEHTFPAERAADPGTVLVDLATAAPPEGGERELVPLGGGTALRTEHVVPAGPSGELPAPASRRVEYLTPAPGGTPHWLAIAFSTLGAGDPHDELALLLVELFDAIMTTFRWTTEAPQ